MTPASRSRTLRIAAALVLLLLPYALRNRGSITDPQGASEMPEPQTAPAQASTA